MQTPRVTLRAKKDIRQYTRLKQRNALDAVPGISLIEDEQGTMCAIVNRGFRLVTESLPPRECELGRRSGLTTRRSLV